MAPGPRPAPRTPYSLSPSGRLHAGAAPRHSISGVAKEALSPGCGCATARAAAWERLTGLFLSGSFCRIVLALFSTLHMGKTEGVPYKTVGCVTIFDIFLVLFP